MGIAGEYNSDLLKLLKGRVAPTLIQTSFKLDYSKKNVLIWILTWIQILFHAFDGNGKNKGKSIIDALENSNGNISLKLNADST